MEKTKDEAPVSPEKLAQHLLNPLKTTNQKAEQFAFMRLIRGYSETPEVTDWVSFSSWIDNACSQLLQLNFGKADHDWDVFFGSHIEDPTILLHERESAIITLNTSDSVSFVRSVHISIQTTLFAIEWEKSSHQSQAEKHGRPNIELTPLIACTPSL